MTRPTRSPRPRLPAALNENVSQALKDTMTAPDRLTPMLAGASCIRPARGQAMLIVRTAGADVEVRAPQGLLNKVFDLCDGTRTVNEVLALLPQEGERAEFAEFMAFLFQEGALIDASLACAKAARYGFQFSPFGLAAPAPLTNQICRRFLWNLEGAPAAVPAHSVKVPGAPLGALFEQRVTQYTFDDKTLSPQVLHQLLWSAAGVVSLRHPRAGSVMPQRTLASAGGMHLLKFFVALRRQVGPYAPGVYRVEYPAARQVALTPVGGDVHTLPLVFSKPWQVGFATGALIVAADPAVGAMRYRNRSLQYLFMEAGAALHNVALSAHTLGVGQATIGGYYEGPAARLCGLADGELVLGTSIFGAQATPQQLQDANLMPDIDFAWVNGESAQYSMGFHLARAKVITEDDDRPHTWGRDVDPLLAMRKAMAEAIEREGYRQPRHLERGLLTELPGAVDPRRCVRYSEAQYDTPGFFYQRFDPTRTYSWTQARNLATGEAVRVLAEQVYSRASLEALGHATPHPVTQVTSSGCAAGLSLADATERALREVIERDAFMRHWLAQRPGRVVPPAQWPKPLAVRLHAIEATGCRVLLQQLDSPWLHVAMVAVQHDALHFTTLGMAASHHAALAAEGALDETEARVYAWLHGHRASITQPEEVATTEHHFELYGLKRHYRKADRVLFPKVAETTPAWPRPLKRVGLDDLVRQLARAGHEVLVSDITPDLHHLDQGRTPLSVAKVIVPGLLPISFGYRREPLGLVDKVHPAASMPHPFP